MNSSIFGEIENALGELIKLMPEKEYVKFVEDDELMHIYDLVALMEKPEGILTDNALKKILKKVQNKIDEYINKRTT